MITRLSSLALAGLLLFALLLSACSGGQAQTPRPQVTSAPEAGPSQDDAAAREGITAPQTGGTTSEQAAPGDAIVSEEGEVADDEDMALLEEPAAEAAPPPVGQAPAGVPAPLPTALATAPAPDIESESEASEEIDEGQTNAPQDVEVNPFTSTTDDNLSTFAMDVDTASYSASRNYINSGTLPPPDTVRVEEFVNYFRYGYANPQQDAFGITVDAAPSPFGAADTYFVRVGIQGQRIETSQRDDAMLTFVIDISGSMAEPNRLPLVQDALRLLVEQLRETDQVAIVVYSDDTRVVLEPTSAAEADTIISAIDSLQIEGSTNVEAGLRLGYQLASANFRTDAINRVILCSDGVANVGATGPDEIRQSIRDYAAQGVLLTTVGFGMGDFNDYLMEQLADDGDGNYAYVDTIDEAERVFVENLTGTLQVIAKDAKIQVDFNPAVVSQYRLLGYENRAVADEDFRNDQVDAGEVGAGHSVTALYEVVPTHQSSGIALVVQVRYEDPESGEVYEVQTPLDSSAFAGAFAEAPANLQLAVAVAGFAENLRNSGYAQDRPLDQILTLAEQVAPQFANDTDVQEFVKLVRQTQTMEIMDR